MKLQILPKIERFLCASQSAGRVGDWSEVPGVQSWWRWGNTEAGQGRKSQGINLGIAQGQAREDECCDRIPGDKHRARMRDKPKG